VDSLGFCYEHTWQAINLELSDPLEHAILYQDLVKDAKKKIVENEKNAGSQLASALEPVTACPVCRIEETTLERVIDSMAIALRNQDFVTEFKESSGLCGPHLKRIMPNLEGKRAAAVISHQRACMESLKGELAEFIRKSEYCFRDEVIGKEGDSYKRAAG
jgi:hypothetical protein